MREVHVLRAVIAAVATGCLVLHVLTAIPQLGATTFDDAYMFIRYANNFLSGNGFSWNASDGPAYGATSTSYLFTVTAARGLFPLSDATVLTGLSFAAGLLSCVILVLAGFLYGNHLRKSWIPLLIIPAMILGGAFRFHSLTGMETTISLLGNSVFVLSLLLYEKRPDKLKFFLLLASAYASYLTRPDNGIYCLLLPPLFLWASGSMRKKQCLLYIVLFGVIISADLLFKKIFFGSALPVPFYAKSAGFYQGYSGLGNWNAIDYLIQFLRSSLPFLLAAVLLVTKQTARRILGISLPMLLTFIYFTTVIQIMGWEARYYYPSLPFFIMMAYVVLENHFKCSYLVKNKLFQVSSWRIMAALFAVLLTTSPLITRVASSAWERYALKTVEYTPNTEYFTRSTRDLPSLGWWEGITGMSELLEKMPPGLVFAGSEYGFISSENPDVTIIDMVGLHDISLARNGFSADYILSRNPDILWLPHTDYSYFRSDLIDNEIFDTQYEYYPGVFNYGIAFNKNSEYFQQIIEIMEDQFLQLYPGHLLEDYKGI